MKVALKVPTCIVCRSIADGLNLFSCDTLVPRNGELLSRNPDLRRAAIFYECE